MCAQLCSQLAECVVLHLRAHIAGNVDLCKMAQYVLNNP